MMKQRDAEQGEPEQNEIDRDAEEELDLWQSGESGRDHPTESERRINSSAA